MERIRGSDLKNFVLGADRTVIILFMPESADLPPVARLSGNIETAQTRGE